MNQARSQKIVMDGYGSYLGMEKGCFVLKDKKGEVERCARALPLSGWITNHVLGWDR